MRGEKVTRSDLLRVARDVYPAVKLERTAAAELGTTLYLS